MAEGFLPALLTKYNRIVNNGTILPQRSALNVIGATATDDPANDATNLTIVGGSGSSGGATSVTFNFTQPAVNSTVNVSVGTTAGIQSGQSIAIGGGGYYINTSTVDATHLLLLNTGAAVNASPAATILSGDIVTVAGQGASLAAAAPLNGQALQLVGGVYTPVGHHPVINVLSYGADPTGNVDATIPFRNAIAAAASAKLPLYIPPGSYITSDFNVISSQVEIVTDNSPFSTVCTISCFAQSASYWGGGWVGEAFAVLPATVAKSAQYINASGFWWLRLGADSPSSNLPLLFLTESPFGSLNGYSAFTWQEVVNFTTTPVGTPERHPACMGSASNNSAFTSAFNITWNDHGGGHFDALVTITTTSGTHTVATSGGSLANATVYCIAVEYDSTAGTLKFKYGAPGASATVVTTSGITGTIVQGPFEDFLLGGSPGPGLWPFATVDGTSGMRYGSIRKSNIARGITTMPSSEFTSSDADSHADLVVSFAPAFTTSSSYPQTLVVAGCGHPQDFDVVVGGIANVPHLLRGIMNTNTDNGPAARFTNVAITSVAGCITVESSVGVITNGCNFTGQKGITRLNNSYYGEDHDINVSTHISIAGNVSHAWGAGYIGASGASITTNLNCPNSTGIPIVFSGSGGSITGCKANTINGQCFLYINGNDAYIHDTAGGDEAGSGTQNAIAMFNQCTQVTWIGGGSNVSNGPTTAAGVRIDGGSQYRFDCDFACGPGSASAILKGVSNTVFPVRLESSYQGQQLDPFVPWTDGTLSYIITGQELAQQSAVTFPSDNDYTVPVNKTAYCDLVIDTTACTATHNAIINPNTGKRYRASVIGGHSATVKRPTGSGITVSSGSFADLYDNGTNIVAR